MGKNLDCHIRHSVNEKNLYEYVGLLKTTYVSSAQVETNMG